MDNEVKKISVIIPAHNEEHYIKRCIESIVEAGKNIEAEVEIVVALNRCTDTTELIAKEHGAVIVKEEEANIAKVRNAGILASSGDIIVTIDADNRMDSNMLSEVIRLLDTGKYIGGGVLWRPERWSLGFIVSSLILFPFVLPKLLKNWVSLGMFWARKVDVEQIGGFDEKYITGEDYAFAAELRNLGKQRNLKYGTITKAKMTISMRKFDQFGDWFMLRNPKMVKEGFSGKNRKMADKYFYKTGR